MKIHNQLPLFQKCMSQWKDKPDQEEFIHSYYAPLSHFLDILFEGDGSSFYSILDDLDWASYRESVLSINPQKEEMRLRRCLQLTEDFFGLKLKGEVLLFGAFHCMDGYARFDRGSHCVFLGVDENYQHQSYLDILMVHELTHVVRESQSQVWKGFGLNPKMTHDEFVNELPTIEHLFGEGFSCVVSEILIPKEDLWNYTYQSSEGLDFVLKNASSLDRQIKRELTGPAHDYSRLYNPGLYGKDFPRFCHYVWAWQWVKQVIQDFGRSDPRNIFAQSSKDFINHALEFRLK